MLSDLIERVRAATGPSFVLEGQIRDLLEPHWTGTPFPYTASLDAAVALTERMLPGYGFQVGRPSVGALAKIPWGEVWTTDGDSYEEFAPTPALALVLATLMAKQAQEATDD